MNNPWRHLPSQSPYVLPDDRECIERFNGRLRSRKSPHWIHVKDVLPEPFAGDVESAPVLLLLSNPGFKESNRKLHLQSEFQDVLRANLRHENSKWPFYFFDERLDASNGVYPGVAQWKKQTRKLAAAVGTQCCGIVDEEAASSAGWRTLARNLAVIEWFPYRSSKFKSRRPCRVPSQEYGFSLVANAINRNALIIIGRSETLWKSSVCGLRDHHKLMKLSSSQSAYLTEKNLRWLTGAKGNPWDMLVKALYGAS